MTFDKIQHAQSRIAQAGGKQLGSLLWWSLNGNRIGHERLLDLADQHGLNTKYLPKEIRPVQAFRRAWRHAAAKLPKGMLLRSISETNYLVVIGLVRERVDERNHDLDYTVLSKIGFHKGTHALSADKENGVTMQVKELYRHHLAHTTEDIRAMMTSFLGEAGVSLRDSGGVYFIPASHQQTLDALCAVVEEVGHNKTYQLPIVDTPEGKATLREVARRTLDSEIQQLQEQLAKFDLDKVRESTLERKLEGFDELRARANLFARVLSFKADTLNKKIASIQSGLRRQLSGEVQVDAVRPTSRPPVQPSVEPFAADVGF